MRGNVLVSSSRLPRNNPGGNRDTPYRRPTTAPDIRSQPEPWHQLLDEIRRGVDEQRKIKEDVRRIGQVVGKLEESLKQLSDQLKEFTEQTFSVESSPYKVSINASNSFCICFIYCIIDRMV